MHKRWLAILSCLTVAAAPSDAPALRVGSQAFSVSDLQAWLASAPGDGDTTEPDAERTRSLITEQFVPLAQLDAHAARTVATDTRFQHKLDAALAAALEGHLSSAIEITDVEVASFYERNRSRYEQPEAIHIWRILTPDAATAKKIIQTVEGSRKGVYEWGNLTRKHSLDGATKHRDGSLGFVRADGTTDVPQVRVDPAIHAAARELKDGQLAAQPTPEGERYAVVWRRGTRHASRESLESQATNIRELLRRDKLQQARAALVKALRSKHLGQYDVSLLESIEYPMPERAAHTQKNAPPAATLSQADTASLPADPSPAAASPIPSAGDRGER